MPENNQDGEEVIPEAVEPEVEAPKEETSDSTSTEIDYEAIAKEEAERTPDPVRAKIALKERQAKRGEDDDMVDEEDRPVSRRELAEIIASTQSETTKTLNENRAVEIARTLSGSPAEARAIVATWRNRQFPGNLPLQDQIEEVQAGINRKKNVAVVKEVIRAAASRTNASKDAAGTHQDPPETDEPKLSGPDAQGLKSAGYKWDGAKRLWRKQLPNKKWLNVKSLKEKSWISAS